MPSHAPVPPLSSAFIAAVREHLNQEAALLRRIGELSGSLTEAGFSTDILAQRRPEMESLLHTLTHLQQQRSQLRTALARLTNTPPERVRLFQLPLPAQESQEEWDQLRGELVRLTLKTSGTVRVVQKTLAQWNAVVSSALETVLESSPGESRYTAAGQRRLPPDAVAIEMRT
jgi:outer membrane protein TolC